MLKRAILIIMALPILAFASKPTLYTVTLQPVEQTLYYNGTISPIANVPVISPTEGTVEKKFFSYGQIIKKDQKLFVISSKKIIDKSRGAKVSYLNALAKYQKVQNWKNSTEVLNAEDSLMRSRTSMTNTKMTYEQDQHLYKLEIISKQALEQSKSAYQNSLMSYQQAQRSLKQTLKHGQGDQYTIAKLQYENAKQKYDTIQQEIKSDTVVSPASGIVLVPVANANTSSAQGGNNNSATNQKIMVGSSVHYLQLLMNIGNLDGLSIAFSVPEINVNQIKQGQSATITGAGFPGITLHGKVVEVAAQASANSSGSGTLPTFPATIHVDKITAQQRHVIRSGMGARVALIVYKKQKALTVPVIAVHQNKKEHSYVNLYHSKTGKITQQIIKTGKIMVDQTEVLSGLKAGDKIVLPAELTKQHD